MRVSSYILGFIFSWLFHYFHAYKQVGVTWCVFQVSFFSNLNEEIQYFTTSSVGCSLCFVVFGVVDHEAGPGWGP